MSGSLILNATEKKAGQVLEVTHEARHLILQVRREVGEALENSDISMEIVGVIDDAHLDTAAASKVYGSLDSDDSNLEEYPRCRQTRGTANMIAAE